MESPLFIDSGYSSLKGNYKGEWYKIPTSISFDNESGIKLDSNSRSFDFEGSRYFIGEGSVDENSFSTTSFDFKMKFEPMIIANFRDILDIPNDQVCKVVLSLALVDWDKKNLLIERCSEYVIDGKVQKNLVSIVPQGFGAYYDYVINHNQDKTPNNAFIIEIGYNTINSLYFDNGEPIQSKCKGHPNHGVSSIIKPFTQFLENTYSMAFSEQESLKIFSNGKFQFEGVLQEKVAKKIKQLKDQFSQTLFNSILVSDKKLISTSEVVILSGGGCYFLEFLDENKERNYPLNFVMISKPYEFSNIRGMVLTH